MPRPFIRIYFQIEKTRSDLRGSCDNDRKNRFQQQLVCSGEPRTCPPRIPHRNPVLRKACPMCHDRTEDRTRSPWTSSQAPPLWRLSSPHVLKSEFNKCGSRLGCHCWLALQCWSKKHCWTSQQWHPPVNSCLLSRSPTLSSNRRKPHVYLRIQNWPHLATSERVHSASSSMGSGLTRRAFSRAALNPSLWSALSC